MPAERDHRRTQKKRYTLVFLPESEIGKPKRMTTGIPGFIALGSGVIVLAVLIVLGALVFTPLGVYIPIPNPELENRYHRQIVDIQERLTKLTEDLVFLREYNVRLRKALGESLSAEDSVLIAAVQQRSHSDLRASLETPNDEPQSKRQSEMQSNIELDAPRQEAASSTMTRTVKAVEVELPLTIPVRGYTTQEFNPGQYHLGIDFAGKVGTTIYAAANGSVIFSGWTYEDGYMIMIAHGSGYRTIYKHNRSLLKSAGEYVRRGEPVALLGNSGKTSYGPHLHFEVWKDGTPVNPTDLLLSYQ
jgi:murein DD-endopeptidase MepM/ murein hydrolase activator NlpD